MRLFIRISSLIGIILLTANNLFSQVERFNGPDADDKIFTIGWSPEGTKLAYAWFQKTIMISNGSRIHLKVQDLITDKVLFEYSKIWDEGNVGDGGGYYPDTPDKAWNLIEKQINKKLNDLNIKDLKSKINHFPAEELDNLDAGIRELDGEPGYGVYVFSDNRGEKLIFSIGEMSMEENSIYGYVVNPDRSRIGVIMNSISFGRPYSNYRVFGCHLSSGFKQPGR